MESGTVRQVGEFLLHPSLHLFQGLLRALDGHLIGGLALLGKCFQQVIADRLVAPKNFHVRGVVVGQVQCAVTLELAAAPFKVEPSNIQTVFDEVVPGVITHLCLDSVVVCLDLQFQLFHSLVVTLDVFHYGTRELLVPKSKGLVDFLVQGLQNLGQELNSLFRILDSLS